MRVPEIRHGLATLCRRLLISTAKDLHDENGVIQAVSHGGRSQQDSFDSETSLTTQQLQEQAIAATTALQPKPEHNKASANEILKRILGEGVAMSVSNILVIQNEASAPLKRTEIHLNRAEQAAALLDPLVTALRDSGFDLQVKSSLGVPAGDIWLVCPLNGDKKISVYSRALQTEQKDSAVSLQPRWHRTRQSDWVTQSSSIATAIGGGGDGGQSRARNSHSAFAQGGQERANS